jgi:Spy/CpxP family protein refolding chaperone
MNKTLILLTFIAGAAAGLFGGWLLGRHNANSSSLADPEGKVAALEKEVAAKNEEIRKLGGGRTVTKAEKGPGAAKSGDNAAAKESMALAEAKFKEQQKKRQEKMKSAMETRLKLKVDERLSVLKEKLGLSDEQAAAVRPLLEKNTSMTDMAMTMYMNSQMEGDLTPEERKAKSKEMFLNLMNPSQHEAELDKQLAAVLTPSQQEGYGALKAEQRANRVEVTANKELGRIQSLMTLTSEQKDQAFAILSRFATEEQAKPIPPLITLASMEPGGRKSMENEVGKETVEMIGALSEESKNRRQRRTEAMKAILTPEQFGIYEAQQKDRSAEISEAMSEFGGMMVHGMMEEDADANENSQQGDPRPPSIPSQK